MTHINQRRDTAANWAFSNPVLQLGEVGWETDTRRSKLGDGVTAWNDLLYTVSDPSVTKDDIGLGEVDNTSDFDKPISTATQVALALKANTSDVTAALATKADLASPALTGNPTAPTPATTDSDTSLATTAFVQAVVAAALAAERLVQHPVGSIEFNVTNVNPSTYIGGTWVPWGSGRVPVGVDTAQAEFDTVEEVGGGKTHSHGSSQMGAAVYAGGALYTKTRSVTGWVSDRNFSSGSTSTTPTNIGAAGNVEVHGDTDSASNLPPYITCYMWKRTA